MKQNPFPRLCRETKRDPKNQRILDELGAYFESVVSVKPKSKKYGFYEFIGEGKETDDEKEETE